MDILAALGATYVECVIKKLSIAQLTINTEFVRNGLGLIVTEYTYLERNEKSLSVTN